MTADVHAYRASDEFAAAIRDRLEEIRRFGREVIKPWDEQHPNARALWRTNGFSLDRWCAGFDCPDGETPDGLSRAKTRNELIPQRGAVGAPWREAMRSLDRFPAMDPVFKQHGVEVMVWPDGASKFFKPGIDDTADGVFVTWGTAHPEPGEHLSEVPLSAYYAAIEKRDREKAAAS